MKVMTSSWAPFICAVVALAPSTAAGGIGSWHMLSASAGPTDKPASTATSPIVFKIIDFLLPWRLRPLANRVDTSISNGAEGRPRATATALDRHRGEVDHIPSDAVPAGRTEHRKVGL